MKSEMKNINSKLASINEINSAWNFLNIFNSIFSFIDNQEVIPPDRVKELVEQTFSDKTLGRKNC